MRERRRAGRRHRPLSRRSLRPLTLLNQRLRPLGSKLLLLNLLKLLKRLSPLNAKPQRLLRPRQPPGIRMVFMRRRQIKMSPNWVLQPKSSLRRRLLRFWRPRPQALRLRRRLSSCLNRVRNRIRSLRPQLRLKKRKPLNLH